MLAATAVLLPLVTPQDPPSPVVEPAPVEQFDAGSTFDPGRRDRRGGIAVMTLGAVGLVGNAAVAIHFGMKAQQGQRELDAQRRESEDLECIPGHCAGLDGSSVRRDRGTAALAAGLGGTLSASALIVGAIVYRSGVLKTRAWERERAVALSPSPRGLVVSGRF